MLETLMALPWWLGFGLCFTVANVGMLMFLEFVVRPWVAGDEQR